MQNRDKKIRRILKIQKQMHEMEEFRLLQLRRREEELETAQADIIGSLNGDGALQSLFLDAAARRLVKLATEAAQVGREGDSQASRVAEAARRMKTTERFSQKFDKELRAREEKRLFASILEALGSPRGASPR